ncbi:MAG: DUF4231 domain-containing protein [Bacteroidota bacterium]
MTEDTYLKERVDDQVSWYNQKSKRNKLLYLSTQILIVVFSTSIPFLVGFIKSTLDFMSILTGILGVLVTILTGINALYLFKDKWTSYRLTSESLLREKYLYVARASNYQRSEQPFQDFVSRVEMLLSDENRLWEEMFSQEQED